MRESQSERGKRVKALRSPKEEDREAYEESVPYIAQHSSHTEFAYLLHTANGTVSYVLYNYYEFPIQRFVSERNGVLHVAYFEFFVRVYFIHTMLFVRSVLRDCANSQ